jgi:diguanylate cyclase (GGDEF)-like protein
MWKKLIAQRLMLFLIISHISPTFAVEALPLSTILNSYDSFKVFQYKDDTALLSLSEVRNIANFEPAKNTISKSYTDAAWWLKLRVLNDTGAAQSAVIQFVENLQDRIDCYLINENGAIKHSAKGPGYFVTGKDNISEKAAFSFELIPNEEITIYIRISSYYPMYNGFYVLDKQEASAFLFKIDLWMSSVIGFMAALLLYNLAFFVYSRDSAYLYYILYGGTLLLYQAQVHAFYPFATFKSSFDFYAAGITVPLVVFFLILFSRDILRTRKLFYRIDIVLILLLVLFALMSVVTLFDLKISMSVSSILSYVTMPFLVFVAFKSYFAGNKVAPFYIFAQAVFLVFVIFFILSTDGYLEYSIFYRYSATIASLFEMLFFSLTLVYRIKVLEDDKLAIIEELNIELEAKVKERTDELNASNVILENLAITDKLTGLYNRRKIDDLLQSELARSERFSRVFGFCILDVDKFKNINDTYGHQVGDKVLVRLAELLAKNVRKTDHLGRWGGEEFVIITPEADENKVQLHMSSIRKEIESHVFEISDISFTASFGVTIFTKGDTMESIIKRADDALYKAKMSGRNKVVILS